MKIDLIGTLIALAATGLAFSADAQGADTQSNGAQSADSHPWYGTLGATQTQINGGDLTSIDARLGARITPWLGAEGELSVGVGDDIAPVIGPQARDRLHDAIAAYAVGFLPLNTSVTLLARVGGGENQIGVNNGAGGPGRQDIASLNYGVGAMLNLNPTNAIRIDYTRKNYDRPDLNANTYGVSFVHKF